MNNEIQEFSGRTALVTGAGADVGRAVALAFARAGARVVIHALEGEGDAEAVAAEACALGGEAAVASGDVADAQSAESIVMQALGKFGPIDMLVHCVGIRPHGAVSLMRTRLHVAQFAL
jgi:NAD(P)-dependent dehydrogenase (short-subunit alcohol dehydrogenase family)